MTASTQAGDSGAAHTLYTAADQAGDPGPPTYVGPIVLYGAELLWWASSRATWEESPVETVPGEAWAMSAPLAGGPPASLFGLPGSIPPLGGIAGVPCGVFWADERDNIITISERTSRSVGGGDTGRVASPLGLLADGTNLYFTSSTPSGKVLRARIVYFPSLTAATPVALASSQERPGLVAIDATSVYWTTIEGGTVMSVAKDGGGPPSHRVSPARTGSPCKDPTCTGRTPPHRER